MVLSSLLRLFPVPDYIAESACGLDISDRSVKFVEMSHGSGPLKFKRFGEKDIPEGLIKLGAIVDEASLISVFKKFREENDLKNVVVSLPEEKAFIVKISVPKISKRELRETIELHLEEYIPFSADSVVFDYDIVAEDDNKIHVVVSVMERATVDSYLNVLKGSGFVPIAFEIEAQALVRSLVPQYSKDVYFIVDFGRVRTGFSIADKGKIQFSSTVSIGGDAIVKAVMERFGVKEEMARKMKETRGLQKSVDQDLFFTLTPTVSVLRDEISKHENFWNSHKEDDGTSCPRICKFILTGGDANIPGLADYLASGSNTPFVLGNPWINVFNFENAIPRIPLNQSLRYATAIGLALRQTDKFI